MEMASSAINISSQTRNTSTSPRPHQTSNLTSALQSTTGNELRHSVTNATPTAGKPFGTSRSESLTGMSGLTPQYGSGAQPISVTGSGRNQTRRESTATAGSMATGMSWGGVSVGSWIRDDIIMQGGSSFGVQSSSYHSSSYLPKLEASFMKDFSCCDMILASLHDLLQHFEEAHAQQISAPIGTPFLPTTGGGLASGLPASRGPQQPIRQHQQQQITSSTTTQPSSSQQPTNTLQNARQNSAFKAGDYRATQLQPIQDMDAVEDMEMDDVDDMNGATFEPDFPLSSPSQQYMPQDQAQARSRFGQPASARLPPLDLNGMTMGGNPMQPNFQGLRQSQPSTPIAGRPGGIYHNNPTVSSVNTPTLNAFPLQQQQQQFRHTPESSAPGTPAELDPEFMGGMNNMSMDQTQSFLQGQQDMSGFAFANGNELIDLCIDEPAKRLFSPNGGFTTQQGAQSRLGTAQYGPDSDIARRIREQQRKAGLADTVSGVEGGEQKPFRCPVIGCEKAYKNQNGLKYHKAHGHNNQQLHENLDGTFSIVDPATLSPYPGTLGMEKEKPYKCEVCGKRYKNLNGLKYHKQHSPPCSPDSRDARAAKLGAAPLNAQALNANVAGAGLPGIGEEMVL